MTACVERVIVFTRYPEPGAVKTRLIPALGPDGAALLHRRMTEHTLRRLKQGGLQEASLEIRYDGGNHDSLAEWLGQGTALVPQGPGDLGARMERAFDDAFRVGCLRVVIVGTDCPSITADLVRSAFTQLDGQSSDTVVIGPAKDGGYYLIGLGRPAPELFQHIPWGTEMVLGRTLNTAKKIGLQPVLLAVLDDVDRPEDLAVWERETGAQADATVSCTRPGSLC